MRSLFSGLEALLRRQGPKFAVACTSWRSAAAAATTCEPSRAGRQQHGACRCGLTGVDINPGVHCLRTKPDALANRGIDFICSDYRAAAAEHASSRISFSPRFSAITLPTKNLVAAVEMDAAACRRLGFFINDLHRHPLAYHSIRLLTRTFSKSYLVKNDAPLSVRRGFRRGEWQRLLHDAGITGYTCSWRWAFRWLITAPNT
jgi:hypothetical protein